MELEITRLPLDDSALYSIGTGETDSSGMKVSVLIAWLFDFGVDDTAIADILEMSPNETMFVEVADRAV
jgi:hypothetical protein